MNREEAIKAMLDGKRVRGIEWELGMYSYYELTRVFPDFPFRLVYKESNQPLDFLYEAENWELYKEPKLKVKKWQWVISYTPHNEQLTIYFYAHADDLQKNMVDGKIIQRADWTEIEVSV